MDDGFTQVEQCRVFGVQAMSAEQADALAPMLKALCDPVRLRMASMIAAVPEICVCELAPAFKLSSATISHHLKMLRDSGLVTSQRRGTFVYYRFCPQARNALATIFAMPQSD